MTWLLSRLKHAYNKLFKRDSQRVAFSLCVGLSVLGGMRRLRYCVAHPLTERYIFLLSESDVFEFRRARFREIYLSYNTFGTIVSAV
ncbi:TPA: DUF3265 domain-containing protein [Vibrio vulnificus]|nr:DUF3265 domain-containing protein [Vibrio vulnificus]HAS6060007.1 DUF3265 domain-containing protein [Vibrio vulnificus]HAS6121626.1 DUF3265 domain-containing protein [Vibrio vulnificus]HAS6135800.1 DUF3265 domain-containing protein [Vibrio vulnificus]HAS8237119.1 DUF3265 domain-containing protein [Vibrio vulnificus]